MNKEHSPLPWTDHGYIFDDQAKMHREILDANGEIVCGRDKIMSRPDIKLMLEAVNQPKESL